MMKNPKSPNQNRNQPTNPKCKNDIKPCKKKKITERQRCSDNGGMEKGKRIMEMSHSLSTENVTPERIWAIGFC